MYIFPCLVLGRFGPVAMKKQGGESRIGMTRLEVITVVGRSPGWASTGARTSRAL